MSMCARQAHGHRTRPADTRARKAARRVNVLCDGPVMPVCALRCAAKMSVSKDSKRWWR